MKTKHAMLLTLLLSQTAPVWAIGGENDDQKSTIPTQPKKVLKTMSTQPRKAVKQSDEDAASQAILEKLRTDIQDAKAKTKERLAQYENIPDKNNKVIVIGYSGNGKTTLIEGLAGNLFARDEGGEIKLRSKKPLDGFNIGDGQGKAGTTIPGIWYDKQKSRKMVFCDCPGFGDPGKSGNDIINAAAIRELFTPKTQARVLLVVDENVLFASQPTEFQNLLNEVAGAFPNAEQLKKRISMVVTKKMPHRNPSAKLKALKATGSLTILEEPAHKLFDFLADNTDTRLATFPAALQEGDNYEFDREAIFKIIAASEPTLNPVIVPHLNDSSEVLVTRLAQQANKEATDFLQTQGAPSIITYCKNEIDKDKNSLTTLKTTLPEVHKNLLSLSLTTKPKDILTIMDKLLSPENSVRKTVEMLDFLKGLKEDVTHDFPSWKEALTSKMHEVTEIISDLATHHNTEMVKFLKTQGAQYLVNYCENKINTHQGSVGDLRTKLKVVLKDLRDLQDSTALPTANVFSNKLDKYFNKSTHLKDTVDVFNSLKQNISGAIECNINDWSAALKDVTKIIKKLTDDPEVIYDATTGVLTLKGAIVGTADLSAELAAHPDPKRIDVFGLYKLFVDEGFTAHGTICSFIAPEWTIDSAKTIDLSGEDNSKLTAPNGSAVGNDGSPGVPGGNGGHFYGKVSAFVNTHHLTINTNAGNGGNGGNGVNGANGANGIAGNMTNLTNFQGVNIASSSHFTDEKPTGDFEVHKDGHWQGGFGPWSCHVHMNGTRTVYNHGSNTATPGSNAGKGGIGGIAGYHGSAHITGPKGWRSVVNNGANGMNGVSGQGGLGGLNGPVVQGAYITGMSGHYDHHWSNMFGNHCDHLSAKKGDHWESSGIASHQYRAANGTTPATTDLNAIGQKSPVAQLAAAMLDATYANLLQEYKKFRIQESSNPDASPFVKLFPGL